MRPRRATTRWGRIAQVIAAGLLVLVLLLAIAQLVLPGIAAKAIRDKVARYGVVRSASVEAFPAVTLLWGEADSMSLDAGSLTVSPAQLVELLQEATGVQRVAVDASQIELRDLYAAAKPLALQQASLHKHGAAVSASALLTAASLRSALPPGVRLELLPSSDGVVRVRVTGSLFGFTASVQASVEAVDGKLQLVPSGSLLRGLATITLIDEPHLHVLSVSATPSPYGSSWRLGVEAKLV